MNELPYMVASMPVGSEVKLTVVRKGKEKTIEVTLGTLEDKEAPEPESAARFDLGMTIEEITPELAANFRLSETSGLVVFKVEPGSPAAQGGVRPGDIILEMDQTEVKTLDAFNMKLGAYKTGDKVLLLLKRQAGTLYLTLQIPE